MGEGPLSTAVSPSGPSGSISSPTASSFVACALIRRLTRGFRRPEELGPVCWGCFVPGTMRRQVPGQGRAGKIAWEKDTGMVEFAGGTYLFLQYQCSMRQCLQSIAKGHLSFAIVRQRGTNGGAS